MRSRQFLMFVLAVIITVSLIGPANIVAQSGAPNVGRTTLLGYKVTAGTVILGGHAVTVAAATGNVTASKTDCAAPAYASCNFIYINSSGTVAATVTMATALASGNSVLALAESDGTVITRLTAANQSSAVVTIGPFAQINSCVASASCATPVSAAANLKWAFGTAALSSASPSLATITGIAPAFTATTTMFCTASPIGTTAAIAAAGLAVNLVSTSSFTVTGPNTVTTSFFWQCSGY